MDLASPIRSIIPSAYGPVLVALVRAGVPLSGRQIAALVEGQVGRARVNSVLGEMAEAGLVLAESHPPSVLYRFNHDHVAAQAIESLANLRQLLLDRIRLEVDGWQRPAVAVWLFGSAARGDGTPASDIDLLVVRPDRVSEDDLEWNSQLATLADRVRAWSGNGCEILELSRSQVVELSASGKRLAHELRRDAVLLTGIPPATILRQQRPPVRS